MNKGIDVNGLLGENWWEDVFRGSFDSSDLSSLGKLRSSFE